MVPEEDNERSEKELLALMAIFERYINSDDENAKEELLEEIMSLRAAHLINYALNGFNITLEDALRLIEKADGLSEYAETLRQSILAAFDNLVDFAVAEEYQMITDIEEIEDEDDEDDESRRIFFKYNKRYAAIENMDVKYAASIASYLASVKSTTILTYMTQGDERVRPWHLQYEGFSAPKANFPGWLVPPIEHNCRCYLIEDSLESAVQGAANKNVEMPSWFNPTFKESLAFGGRIFSDAHPYFSVKEEDLDKLSRIANKIKLQYYEINS